jgi:hypothetical protein
MPAKRSILLITEGQRAEPALVRRALAAYGFDAAYEIVPYGANIHDLYARLFADGQDDSVELLGVLKEKERAAGNAQALELLNRDYTDVLLLFDFDPHDNRYNAAQLLALARRFSQSTDEGKLYVSFPMLEAYKHLCALPDAAFFERRVVGSVLRGAGAGAGAGVVGGAGAGAGATAGAQCGEGVTGGAGFASDTFGNESTNVDGRVGVGEGADVGIYSSYKQMADAQAAPSLRNPGHYTKDTFDWVISHNVCKAARMCGLDCAALVGVGPAQADAAARLYFEIDIEQVLQAEVELFAAEDAVDVLSTCLFFICDYNPNLIDFKRVL